MYNFIVDTAVGLHDNSSELYVIVFWMYWLWLQTLIAEIIFQYRKLFHNCWVNGYFLWLYRSRVQKQAKKSSRKSSNSNFCRFWYIHMCRFQKYKWFSWENRGLADTCLFVNLVKCLFCNECLVKSKSCRNMTPSKI